MPKPNKHPVDTPNDPGSVSQRILDGLENAIFSKPLDLTGAIRTGIRHEKVFGINWKNEH